eukprot:ANDGO_05004.mRNA.1 DEP domain-containing protein DDB_G0279099
MSLVATLVSVHNDKFSPEDILISPDLFPEMISHPEDFLLEIEASILLRPTSTSFLAASKSNMQLSIQKTIADSFGIQNRQSVTVRLMSAKSEFDDVALDYVELTFRDQFISRSDMWRFTSSLTGSPAFRNREFSFAGMRAVVREMMRNSELVSSGIITAATKCTFRSRSANFFVLIQLSAELWEYAPDGDIYYEKLCNVLLRDMFTRWVTMGTNHKVTIILFARVESYVPEDESAGLSSNRSEGNSHPKQMKRVLRDEYKIIADRLTRIKPEELVVQIRSEILSFPALVGWSPFASSGVASRRQSSMSKSSRGVCDRIVRAQYGNFLEALNLSVDAFHKHYIDRDLNRTGQAIVTITAGQGIFDVDESLASLTDQRMADVGCAVDLVSLAARPYHSVPLFRITTDPSAAASSADEQQASSSSRIRFDIPRFIQTMFLDNQRELTPLPKLEVDAQFVWPVEVPVSSNRLDIQQIRMIAGRCSAVHLQPKLSSLPRQQSLPSAMIKDSRKDSVPISEYPTAALGLSGSTDSLNRTTMSRKPSELAFAPSSFSSSSDDLRVGGEHFDPMLFGSSSGSIRKSSTSFGGMDHPADSHRSSFSIEGGGGSGSHTARSRPRSNSRRHSMLRVAIGSSALFQVPKIFDPFKPSAPGVECGDAEDPRIIPESDASSGHRWFHIFPDPERSSGSLKWKSLSEPAIMPLTAAFFPEQKDLSSETFFFYNYTLTSSGVYEDKPDVLMRELVCQRLHQGFQLAVSAENKETPLAIQDSGSKVLRSPSSIMTPSPSTQSSPVHSASSRSKPAILSAPSSATPLPAMPRKSPVATYRLSKGGQYHILEYDPVNDYIIIKIYRAENEDKIPAWTASGYVWNPMTESFDPRQWSWNSPQTAAANYNWNSMDALVCGNDLTLTENIRFRRVRFALFPTDKPSFSLPSWSVFQSLPSPSAAEEELKKRLVNLQKFLDGVTSRSVKIAEGFSKPPLSAELGLYSSLVACRSTNSLLCPVEIASRKRTKICEVVLEPQNVQSSRYEWITLSCSSICSLDALFLLNVEWLVCTGMIVEELVRSFGRRAAQHGLAMIPIPHELPFQSDALLPRVDYLFADAAETSLAVYCLLSDRFRFLSSHHPVRVDSFLLHESGAATVVIVSGTCVRWYPSALLQNGYAKTIELLAKFDPVYRAIRACRNIADDIFCGAMLRADPPIDSYSI